LGLTLTLKLHEKWRLEFTESKALRQGDWGVFKQWALTKLPLIKPLINLTCGPSSSRQRWWRNIRDEKKKFFFCQLCDTFVTTHLHQYINLFTTTHLQQYNHLFTTTQLQQYNNLFTTTQLQQYNNLFTRTQLQQYNNLFTTTQLQLFAMTHLPNNILSYLLLQPICNNTAGSY
jgi:hypothetical protein